MEDKPNLDKDYWTSRYQNADAVWDLGEVSRPIKEYIDQLEVDDRKILIPGCGNGHEGEYLLQNGFQYVYFLDFSELPLENIKSRCPAIPDNHLICNSIFDLEGSFDLIIEQTLFCALDPSLREDYVKKLASLLTPNGKIVGLLFNVELEDGPPFGGSKAEYLALFGKYFEEVNIDDCYNSIPKREGKEVFISMKKVKVRS